jgi:hypothetical protein
MDLGSLASWSALLAAAATVIGALFLGLFFAKGQPWGTLNDLASIVLMLATIPVAVRLAEITAQTSPTGAVIVAAIGIVGMLGATAAQSALVLRLGSYAGLLPYTLGAGGVVGAWYLLVGALGVAGGMPGGLALLAFLSGIGYAAIAVGFWRWGQEPRPASVLGGIFVVVGSTLFLGWVGVALLGSEALSA